MTSRAVYLLGAVGMLAMLTSSAVRADERPGDQGETPQQKALRGRMKAPTPAQIDGAVTLDGLLAKKDQSSWSESKGATIEGYVIQTEREEDGDYHLTLASSAGETDTRKWVIVEVPPAWQKKGKALTPSSLRGLYGKKVRVTGWLYWEPDEEQPDPRGTRWEIHPVTAVTLAP